MKNLTLSVLQFNTFVKNILDAEDFLSNISIFGEVTNFKISGGHAYFDLKDENAMLSCVKFGAGDLAIKNGDQITVYGKVNFYVKSGRLNFIVAKAETAGMGELYQRFLLLKEKLEKQGYFREEIKKPIPKFAKRIGVVTSKTGAVIRDIINVTKSKNPYTDIVVYPSKVQGEGAENEIVSGIKYFNTRDDIDTIIIARGGGSLEDLAPFNTEKLVLEIFNSNKPIISAVGHETDFTLCDFASDLRVPTPSVAAEVAVFDFYEQVNQIQQIEYNNYYFITKYLSDDKKMLSNLAYSVNDKVKLKLSLSFADVNLLINGINEKINKIVTSKSNTFDAITKVVSKLNPLEILKNGYSVIEKNKMKVSSVKSVGVGDELNLTLSDGKILAKVTDVMKGELLWHLKKHWII